MVLTSPLDHLRPSGAIGNRAHGTLLLSLCAPVADGLASDRLEVVGTARSGYDEEGYHVFARKAFERLLPATHRQFDDGAAPRERLVG